MHQGMMKNRSRERAPIMNPSTMLSALHWAEDTFGSVHLGDVRRTHRAVAIASAIAHNPAASLPAQMPDEAELEATYRFLHTPDVTYEQLIGPHVAQTREEASKQQVLLIQDTTEVDDQQHPTTTGLGPIGNGTHHG
jgi:transposase-like protein